MLVFVNGTDVMIGKAFRIARFMHEGEVVLAIEAAKTGPGSEPDKACPVLMDGPHKGRWKFFRVKAPENPPRNMALP